MNFGYFFLGVSQSDSGSSGKVAIRPMALGFPTESAAQVVIQVPLDTSHGDKSLSAIAAHCLQSVRELLPESALQAWSATWGTDPLLQPTIPADAVAQWTGLGSEPEPTQEQTSERFRALGS